MRAHWIICAAFLVGLGCDGPESLVDLCQAAQDHVAECTGSESNLVAPSASPDECEGSVADAAGALLALSCEELELLESTSDGFWCSPLVRWIGLCEEDRVPVIPTSDYCAAHFQTEAYSFHDWLRIDCGDDAVLYSEERGSNEEQLDKMIKMMENHGYRYAGAYEFVGGTTFLLQRKTIPESELEVLCVALDQRIVSDTLFGETQYSMELLCNDSPGVVSFQGDSGEGFSEHVNHRGLEILAEFPKELDGGRYHYSKLVLGR